MIVVIPLDFSLCSRWFTVKWCWEKSVLPYSALYLQFSAAFSLSLGCRYLFIIGFHQKTMLPVDFCFLFPHLWLFFRRHWSLRSHFYPLVFESLKGSVKGSIWSAGKTISIGRLLGSGFAEKNASSTIYGINKPNLLSHKLTNWQIYANQFRK